MKDMAKKLGLTDKGIYPNHRCVCGANIRLGVDGSGQAWTWCPKCRCKLNVVAIPIIPQNLS